MATPDRLWEILAGLVEKTEAGSQTWVQAEDDETAFRTRIGSYSLEIESADGDGAAPYNLSVLDENGDTVEVAESQTVSGTGAAVNTARQRNRQLRELYDLARRKALGIDIKLDEIARGLGLD